MERKRKKEMEKLGVILFKKKDNIRRWIGFLKKVVAEEGFDDVEYLAFETATEFMYCNNIHQVVEQLQKKDVGWNHPNFTAIREEFAEQDDFLENPPEVEEGVMECKRCHSKRTFSFSKQTRRSDESATVFIRCSNCSYMYRM